MEFAHNIYAISRAWGIEFYPAKGEAGPAILIVNLGRHCFTIMFGHY